VKAFSINQNDILHSVKQTSYKAKELFSEIEEIWLFGSCATGNSTGMSDVDILIVANYDIANPIERIKPYYFFFSDCLDIACDILVIKPEEKSLYGNILSTAVRLV